MPADRELTCRDCGSSFVFTSGEQEFYASKGLQHDPVRCPACRANRKAMRPEDRNDAPNYGVFVSWGGRTPRQLHAATCAECAQVTEVPFLPRGDRPVYCSSCYNAVRERQEADEAAAAERLAAMAAGASDPARDLFEGTGRDNDSDDANEGDGDASEAEVPAAEAETEGITAL